MPTRIVVTLEPSSPGALPPPHTGPGVAAAVLAALDRRRPDLAARFHDAAPPKPYTLTPLLDERDQPPRAGSATVRFELGLLVDELFAPVYEALLTEQVWRVGRTAYRPLAVEAQATASYAALAAQATPATEVGFRLITPMGFSTAKEEGARRQRPLPQPEWVFRALAARWHAFAPPGGALDLPSSLGRAVEEHLEVVDCELRIAEHLVKPKVLPVRGCVGTIRYGLADAGQVPADAQAALDLLATFATYAGLGDRTTIGMGHATRLPGKRPGGAARAR
ncbi:CRISPR system precrRNA processing endoribonuclease RAMP protein Cas6 [Frankia tisae]|uniref:CRISPR system precrRNA processing endoribonuclease RAMP protein Cas6 n=1 Tax=Frankia tisae TaxID=2950104 RepID=UPI0021BEAF88|nr:CRISPR system precrRNA processing endoribonuclease RAMP protein Cas6 [Frankia tisae]